MINLSETDITKMVSDLKTIYRISDTSLDDTIRIIIDRNVDLLNSINCNEAVLFYVCSEDLSAYLKSGNSVFETSQSMDLKRYSQNLQSMITRNTNGRAY